MSSNLTYIPSLCVFIWFSITLNILCFWTALQMALSVCERSLVHTVQHSPGPWDLCCWLSFSHSYPTCSSSAVVFALQINTRLICWLTHLAVFGFQTKLVSADGLDVSGLGQDLDAFRSLHEQGASGRLQPGKKWNSSVRNHCLKNWMFGWTVWNNISLTCELAPEQKDELRSSLMNICFLLMFEGKLWLVQFWSSGQGGHVCCPPVEIIRLLVNYSHYSNKAWGCALCCFHQHLNYYV